MGKDIMNGFKTLVGGELSSYNEMMNGARALATKRMVEDAQAMGADAIVCMRYSPRLLPRPRPRLWPTERQ